MSSGNSVYHILNAIMSVKYTILLMCFRIPCGISVVEVPNMEKSFRAVLTETAWQWQREKHFLLLERRD